MSYPDILGYITGGTRQNPGIVQAAAATRPTAIHPGHPFEIVVVVQNTVASRTEIAIAVGKKNWLALAQEQVKAALEPGEVGVMTIGARAHPKTPNGQQSLTLDIQTTAANPKAPVIRPAEGGEPFMPDSMPQARQKALNSLKRLTYSTKKRGLLRTAGLEIDITVQNSPDAAPLKPRTGWHSLWTLDNLQDLTPLVEQYGELLTLRLLPKLNRQTFHAPLRERVGSLFADAGYPLQPLETEAITRLMLLVLEYANAADNGHSSLYAGMYDVRGKLANGSANSLPRWTETMLRAVARDDKLAKAPQKRIPQMAYDALLYDAVMLGFRLVDDATGESLGTPDEMQTYAEKLLHKLAQRQPLTFSDAYMPLITGGVIAYEYVLLTDERLSAVLDEMKSLLQDRESELDDQNELVFELADTIITQSLRKYGTLDSRNL